MENKDLYSLVIEEAKNLKIHATKEELFNLDLEKLNPMSKTKCIYGQMTKDCTSERAHELIKLCTKVVIGNEEKNNKIEETPLDFSYQRMPHDFKFYSPIEKFIYTAKREYLENLINFLQDKTKELKFN